MAEVGLLILSMNALAHGFLLSLSLIFAIGAQNAFILRQGILGRHVFILCLFCALSDALLISVGVAGFYFIVQKIPSVLEVARYGGAAFIAWYGISRLIAAAKGGEVLDSSNADDTQSLKSALSSCCAFTFLNPHVYLDTVLLLGSVSAQFKSAAWKFGVGASLASFFFFFSLGYGAVLLRPLFLKPVSWRVLDVVIGITMLIIAGKLLFLPS